MRSGMGRAGLPRNDVLQHVLGHEPDAVLEQRAGDGLPASGFLPLAQRRHHADHSEHAAHHVDHGRARAQRPAWRSRHVGEPAHHLRDLVQRGAVRVGPGQEPLERHVDQPRVDLGHGLGSEPELRHGAGPEVLGQDIGRGDELARDRHALRRFQVERDRALVAVECRKEACAGADQTPRIVAVGRRLDLDHVGAEVAENEAAARPHDHVAELDDADARQGQTLLAHVLLPARSP